MEEFASTPEVQTTLRTDVSLESAEVDDSNLFEEERYESYDDFKRRSNLFYKTDTDKNQLALAERGGFGPSLIALVHHDTPLVRELANVAINNLVMTVDGSVTVKSSEAIVPILRLGICDDPNIQSKAVWALSLIASNQEGNVRLMNCLPASWVLIKKLCVSKTIMIQWGVATILGFLSLYPSNHSKMIQRDVASIIKQLSTSESVLVQRTALNAFANLSDDPKNALQLVQESGVDYLIDKLNTTDVELIQTALHCLANVANTDDTVQEEMIKKGILDKLFKLLQHKEWLVQESAALILCFLSSNIAFKKEFSARLSFEPVFEALLVEDEDLTLNLVTMLNTMIQDDNCKKKLSAYIETTKNTNNSTVDLLMQLAHHTENHDVQRETLLLLRALQPDLFLTSAVPHLSKTNVKTKRNKTKAREHSKQGITVHLIKMLFSSDKTIAEDALSRLYKEYPEIEPMEHKQSPENVIKILLYLCRTTNSTTIRREAIYSLRAIAKKDEVLKDLVCKNNALDVLIDLIKSRKKQKTTSVLHEVLKTICYLISSAKEQNKIREGGLVPLLINICYQQNERIQRVALKLLYKSTFDNALNQYAFRNAGGLKLIEYLFNTKTSDAHFQSLICKVVYAVCYNNATLQKHIGEPSIVRKLVEIVRTSHSVLLLYRAIDAINALCINNNIMKELVTKLGGLDPIIELISQCKASKIPNSIVSCALSCLSSLVDGNCNCHLRRNVK
jgi:hypothetical protein